MDDAERQNLYEQAVALTTEEYPWLFLYQQDDVYGVSNEVNWEPPFERADLGVQREFRVISPPLTRFTKSGAALGLRGDLLLQLPQQ